jgi:hypothetical protein
MSVVGSGRREKFVEWRCGGAKRRRLRAPTEREVLASEPSEGTRELALSEDERAKRVSQLGRREGCTVGWD